MLHSLKITGFRCFKRMQIENLTRVNLLVGANNSGKTAALEAVELLSSGPNPSALFEALIRREEYSVHAMRLGQYTYDFRSLFCGRKPQLGDAFALYGNSGTRSYEATLKRREEESGIFNQQELPLRTVREQPSSEGGLQLNQIGVHHPLHAPQAILQVVTERGAAEIALWGQSPRHVRVQSPSEEVYVPFLGTALYPPRLLSDLWDAVALTPHEDRVLRALQIIEPDVARLAMLGAKDRQPSPYVQLKGSAERIPLGSMGEGMKRLLALALAVGTASPGGVCLVDEIDTGLHHSVMARMWKLIVEAAAEFDFQLFATTHSRDCLEALRTYLEQHPDSREHVSVHRLEAGQEKAVSFSADELAVAVEQDIEVR